MKGEIKFISRSTAMEFILPRHYAGRAPATSWCFGWYINNKLVAVCTFGKPASNSLCEGVCGKELSSKVYELNRLCRIDELTEPLSAFVGACLRRLSAYDVIVVSYSDTAMNHNGYIYQATNFFYTGTTAERTDKFTEGNKHSRHYKNDEQKGIRKVRSAKNRYIFMACKYGSTKKKYLRALKYPILPYPKAVNKNYTLGEYQDVVLTK